MSDSLRPGFPVLTISQNLLKLRSFELVMPSNHLILFSLFSSCPQSFSVSGSFPIYIYLSWKCSSTSLALVVQWLRLCMSSAGHVCWIPGQRTKIPRVLVQPSINKFFFFLRQMFVHTTYQSVSVTSRFGNCCSGANVNWTVNEEGNADCGSAGICEGAGCVCSVEGHGALKEEGAARGGADWSLGRQILSLGFHDSG